MTKQPKHKSLYELTNSGDFVITDYQSTKLFSSFFPGIAGENGIPMWVFYVNRGQCVCSMGIQDKQNPIMEFLPANWAYQLVSSQGFRTFFKLSHHPTIHYYEPFQDQLSDHEIRQTQRMVIAPSKLILEELNETLGLKITVEYFTVPQDNYAGIIRNLHIENLNSEEVSLEILDGLPLIIPYGVDNTFLKHMRRLIEAFVEVTNYDRGVPFFKAKVEPADRPDVLTIEKGNFYIGFEARGQETRIVTPVVDPVKIFGFRSDLSYPENFLKHHGDQIHRDQILENRLPCAMGHLNIQIPAGGQYTYTSIIGHASSVGAVNSLATVVLQADYVGSRDETNQIIINALTQQNLICSGEPGLDHYTRQNFLDNTLRGGFPVTFRGKKNRTILHLYSRKHGDLERDYNDFRLTPTPYSQGNGNFRDINQNRRSDLFFNPDVNMQNVEHFYNLLQLDGYNPLVLKEIRFIVSDTKKLPKILSSHLSAEDAESVMHVLQAPFTPGELMSYIRENHISLNGDTNVLLGDLLEICNKIHSTEYGEGFWTDHWTYNLDLLENYLAVYPENYHYLLFEKKTFSFYDNPHYVKPRDDKYVIWEEKAMQLDAVGFDKDKDALIRQRVNDPNKVRTKYGNGKIYFTSLLNKIVSLIVIKLSSLDPAGVGVEMEAGKPNWYDALNGLPGFFGSSISETLEIRRNILFLQKTFKEYKIQNEKWKVFEEIKELMDILTGLLKSSLSPMEFWEKAASAREDYRKKTRLGISGKEKPIRIRELNVFLELALNKLNKAVEKAWDEEKKILFTYFRNDVTDYQIIEIPASGGRKKIKHSDQGLRCFHATRFKQTPLPYFLEGPVHYLRCYPGKENAETLVRNIRESELYDSKLKMYKVNASLAKQPMEIGRTRVFTPGWFENESVWLHMEYKYMLELLRNKLYEEFFRDFKHVFIPFFDPEIYGRSILENSSFIVSSANPDPSIHGNGFVARLSGATAEFISILFLMMVGSKPFRVKQDGDLQLEFTPALPEWLFTQSARKIRLRHDECWQEADLPSRSFSFMFLGNILVTYRNQLLKPTFGPHAVKPVRWKITDRMGKQQTFQGELLYGDTVTKIRNRQVTRIEIDLE